MNAKKQDKAGFDLILSITILLVFLYCSVFLADEISAATLNGMSLAVRVIVPTAFPFMIFSDFAAHCFSFEKSNALASIFERFFKINRNGLSAFFSGLVGGFPIGAKSALNLYKNEKISKCECERLMCFSNIASPAYVIFAVGGGILKSFKLGVALYSTLIISSVLSGLVIGINKDYTEYSEINTRQSFNFVSSVKTAAIGSVNVIFFISFFGAVSALITALPLSAPLSAIILSFTEVGNAVLYLSDLCIFGKNFRLALIGFSLSFSGLSVILQSVAIEGGDEMSIKKCILYKLLSGIISFIIILIIPI